MTIGFKLIKSFHTSATSFVEQRIQFSCTSSNEFLMSWQWLQVSTLVVNAPPEWHKVLSVISCSLDTVYLLIRPEAAPTKDKEQHEPLQKSLACVARLHPSGFPELANKCFQLDSFASLFTIAAVVAVRKVYLRLQRLLYTLYTYTFIRMLVCTYAK